MFQSHWPRWLTRSLALSGLLATIGFTYCVVNPDVFSPWLYSSHYHVLFLDLLGRIDNLKQLHEMGNIYLWNGPEAFTYPPGAIIFFWPLHVLSFRFWQYFSVFASLSSLALTFTILLHKFRNLTWPVAVAVGLWASVLLAAFYPPVMSDLIWGNISTVIFATTVLDCFVVPQRYRGVLVGLTAAIKIYPIVFIIWWAWRRQWREVRNAIASSAALTFVAACIWWPSAHTFVATQVLGGAELHRFRATSLNSSSVVAFFSRPPFHPGDGSILVVGVISLVILALSFRGAAHLLRENHPWSAFIVLSIGMRVVMPIAWDHYFVFIPFTFFIILELGARAPMSRMSFAALGLMTLPWVFLRVGHPTPTSAIQAIVNFFEQNIILGLMVAMVIVSNLFWRPSTSLAASSSKDSAHG
jgi:alpha-1,2-mannosyltransferase